MYKVIKINDGQRIYFQVRKEDTIYPSLTKNSVTVCMAYDLTAQEAIEVRDRLTEQYKYLQEV